MESTSRSRVQCSPSKHICSLPFDFSEHSANAIDADALYASWNAAADSAVSIAGQRALSATDQRPTLAQNMRELRQSAPSVQSDAASASATTIDLVAMWNQLLPGIYGELIPMFRNSRQQQDFRVLQTQIPQVITFLEAWDNVTRNLQPPWYQAALADYSIVARLKWIFFDHGSPIEWISPLPDANMQVIFTENVPIAANTVGTQNAGPNNVQQPQTQPNAGSSNVQQPQT
eukprot:2633983-Amphidinium_carterae.1